MNFGQYGDLVEVSCALRRFYGLPAGSPSNPCIEQWLRKNSFRCVVVLLIDAMGTSILKYHLTEDSFFRRYTAAEVSSVFPPTTAAATIALLSGKYPAEDGWLGWNLYFSEVQQNVVLFYEQGQDNGVQYPGLIAKKIPVNDIVDELQAEGICAEKVYPGWSTFHPSEHFHDLLKNTLDLVKDKDTRFVYAYWDQLDSLMHRSGPFDPVAARMVRSYSKQTETFARKLPADTGLIVLADHSMIPVESYHIDQDPQLWDCLEHAPSIEPRAVSFVIRQGRSEEFERLFRKRFGDEFLLLRKEEVLHQRVFGKAPACAAMEEFLGDYLAIAQGRKQIIYGAKPEMKGNHAGGTEEEAQIPLILYPAVQQ